MDYLKRMKEMTDYDLCREWEEQPGQRSQVEHEMAERFRHPAPLMNTALFKLLDMRGQFMEAYNNREWFRAMYIYNSAIIAGMLLDIPQELRKQLFGISGEDEPEIQGDFPREIVAKVMEECVVKDGLGRECVVYRIPGEIAFYGGPGGAKIRPGAYTASWEQLMKRQKK